jgi:surfactin synthase thioesterase subunit
LPWQGWLVEGAQTQRAHFRVFCFHCAGGSAAQYRQWAALAPAHVEFAAVQLPGRDQRFAEQPHEELGTLVAQLTNVFRNHLDERPYAFFGHSLGALVAFEVARSLTHAGFAPPEHLVVAARPAPQLVLDWPAVDELPTPELIHVLRRYGGVNEDLLEDRARLAPLLPTMRADFRLARSYTYRDGPPLSCRIVALGGRDDPSCTELQLQAWELQTTSAFRCHMFPGGHFFIRDHARLLVEHLSALV